MIIDWREMRPCIPGEGEDALGRPIPTYTVRVDTVSGLVTYHTLDQYGVAINAEGDGFLYQTLQMVPPITVWLYT